MTIFLALPGNAPLAARLAALTGGEVGTIELRRFPDGETYVRIRSDVEGKPVALVCILAAPDEKILPLVFAASAARSLGARTVILIAPYLAYMRQDAVFQPGEALTSRAFADIVSAWFDRLVTVDPHLHRIHSLSDLYRCAATVVHAAPLLGRWVADHVEAPLIVGPDCESEQWAAGIAALAGAPHIVLAKERRGDRDVRLALPDVAPWRGRQPVLVDDIISSGETLLQAAALLIEAGFAPPHCLAIHALHGPDVAKRLAAVTKYVLATDSVANPAARFDVAPLIAAAL